MSEVLAPAGRLSDGRSEEPIWRRRLLVFALNGASWLALGAVMVRLLGYAGWSWPEVAILVLFLAGLPWTLMGFWNAAIGFSILRLARDPARYTNPALAATPMDSRITSRTAICVALRHEDVERVFARLEAMATGLEATAWSGSFSFHVLSDSSRPERSRRRGRGFRCDPATPPPTGLPRLPAPPGQHRLQGRQHPGVRRTHARRPRLLCSTPTA